MSGWRFLQWIFKKSLEAEIRKEITSGNEASTELVNVILKAIRDKLNLKSEIYLGVFDLTVAADETVFTSSGSELCAKDLTIDGKLINNGAFFITGSLTISGELDNYGEINIGV